MCCSFFEGTADRIKENFTVKLFSNDTETEGKGVSRVVSLQSQVKSLAFWRLCAMYSSSARSEAGRVASEFAGVKAASGMSVRMYLRLWKIGTRYFRSDAAEPSVSTRVVGFARSCGHELVGKRFLERTMDMCIVPRTRCP